MSNAPVKKFRLGRIVASVFNNPSDEGKDRYSISIVRTYKDGDQWKETSSFNPEDLPVVSRLSDRALSAVMVLQEFPNE